MNFEVLTYLLTYFTYVQYPASGLPFRNEWIDSLSKTVRMNDRLSVVPTVSMNDRLHVVPTVRMIDRLHVVPTVIMSTPTRRARPTCSTVSLHGQDR